MYKISINYLVTHCDFYLFHLIEDNHILATVRNNKKIFPCQFYISEVYSISNVKVIPGPALYKSVNIDLAINFYSKIKIQKVTHTDTIPWYKAKGIRRNSQLCCWCKVLRRYCYFIYLNNIFTHVDIAGMVINYGHLEARTNGAQKMDVILANAP